MKPPRTESLGRRLQKKVADVGPTTSTLFRGLAKETRDDAVSEDPITESEEEMHVFRDLEIGEFNDFFSVLVGFAESIGDREVDSHCTPKEKAEFRYTVRQFYQGGESWEGGKMQQGLQERIQKAEQALERLRRLSPSLSIRSLEQPIAGFIDGLKKIKSIVATTIRETVNQHLPIEQRTIQIASLLSHDLHQAYAEHIQPAVQSFQEHSRYQDYTRVRIEEVKNQRPRS